MGAMLAGRRGALVSCGRCNHQNNRTAFSRTSGGPRPQSVSLGPNQRVTRVAPLPEALGHNPSLTSPGIQWPPAFLDL